MLDPIWQIVILVVTSSLSWFFGKLQTKRETKQTDLEIINNAISPLLKSIGELTRYNETLVLQYLEEQRQRLEVQEENKTLKAEKANLAEQVSKLTFKVDRLERTINKLTKNEKDHPADS